MLLSLIFAIFAFFIKIGALPLSKLRDQNIISSWNASQTSNLISLEQTKINQDAINENEREEHEDF